MIFPRKIFYGWLVVFCSILLMSLSVGMFTNTNSLFVKPVCQSLDFSRGGFTLYRTIVLLTGALTLTFYGRLAKKIGVKKILAAGALMVSLVSIGYSFSTKLWQFYILAFVHGLFLNGINFMTVGVLVSSWFNGKKGLATGLAYSGSGLGGVIMIPIVGRIIEQQGWQWAYRFMGILGIALMLPVIIIFIKNNPEAMGLSPFAQDESEQKMNVTLDNLSFREALHSPKLWLLVTGLFFINSFSTSLNTHSAPYFSDLGYSAVYISYIMAFYMFFLTAGKITLGSVYDRFGAMAGNVFISVFSLGFPVFAFFGHIPAMPWLYAMFVGTASCGVSVPVSTLVLRYFGKKDFHLIFSFCMMISNIAPSISTPVMGAVYDYTGSYRPGYVGYFFCSVIIAFCLIGVEIVARNYNRLTGSTSTSR